MTDWIRVENGDVISSKRTRDMLYQLGLSINLRHLCLENDPISFGTRMLTPPGATPVEVPLFVIHEVFSNYLKWARKGCEWLLHIGSDPHVGSGFVRPDNFQPWQDIHEVIEYAGWTINTQEHPWLGWDDGVGHLISNPRPWQQLQDVLDVLKFYRINRTLFPNFSVTQAVGGRSNVGATVDERYHNALNDPQEPVEGSTIGYFEHLGEFWVLSDQEVYRMNLTPQLGTPVQIEFDWVTNADNIRDDKEIIFSVSPWNDLYIIDDESPSGETLHSVFKDGPAAALLSTGIDHNIVTTRTSDHPANSPIGAGGSATFRRPIDGLSPVSIFHFVIDFDLEVELGPLAALPNQSIQLEGSMVGRQEFLVQVSDKGILVDGLAEMDEVHL